MRKMTGKATSLMLIAAMCAELFMPAVALAAQADGTAEYGMTEEDVSAEDNAAEDSDQNDEAAASTKTEADADNKTDADLVTNNDGMMADLEDGVEREDEGDIAETEGLCSEEPVPDAEEVTYEELAYEADSDFEISDGILKKYNGTEEKNVVIPSSVTEIGTEAFNKHQEIETVTFPDGLTKIGEWAFRDCSSLLAPTLPDSLKIIGHGAFDGAALGTQLEPGALIIPASVETIVYEAFKNCGQLGSVEFKGYEGEKKPAIEFTESFKIGDVFSGCKNLKKITLSNKIEKVPDGFAKNCSALEEVVWSDTVTGIGNSAFLSCKALKNADLSATKITEIGEWAFRECESLEAPKFPDTLTEIKHGAFDGAALGTKVKFGELVIPASVETIVYEAFKNCSLLGSVEFKGYEGEKKPAIEFTESFKIGDVFCGCTNLKKITLSNKIEKVPDGFATNCSTLEEVVWSDTVTGIGNSAFLSCKALKNADLSATKITEIGEWAFRECESLEVPKFPDTLTEIGHGAFDGAALGTDTACGDLVIPDSVNKIAYEAFKNCGLLGSVVFKGYENEKKLAIEFTQSFSISDVFYGCKNLKKITLSNKIEKVPNGFASNCTALEEVVWSDTVTSIGSSAFLACKALINVNLSKTKITEIGEWAFKDCETLEAPKFPETLAIIGPSAFDGAALGSSAAYGELYIPSNVEEIKARAFANAKYLGKVTFGPDNGWDVHMKVLNYCFDSCENLKIMIVTGRVDIIPYCFACECKKLDNIKIEDGVKEIKESAFRINNADPKVKTTVEGSSDVVKNYDWEKDGRSRIEGKIKTDLDPSKPGDGEEEGGGGEEEPSENVDETSFYVSFITYGGSVIAAVQVNKGSKVAKPADPEKSGYTFAGWYKDNDFSAAWDFDTDTVTERVYLYAKWDKIQETVTDTPTEEEDDYIKYDMDKRIELTNANCQVDPVNPKIYDGISYKPSLKVKYTPSGADRTVTLTEGIDYNIRYENNVNAGEGWAYVIGCGRYTGETVKTLIKINRKPMSKLKAVAGGVKVGSTRKPVIYVYDGNTLLMPGTDYKADWSNYKSNVKGSYTIPLRADEKSNYTGVLNVKVTVYKAAKVLDASNTDILIEGSSAYTTEFNAGKITPKVTVKYFGQVLESNNYKVTYTNNVSAGTAYITVTGKKKYAGTVLKTFEITPVKKEFELTKKNISVTYNGKLQKPKVTVKAAFENAKGRKIYKKLKAGVDYTITYRNNLHASENAEIIIKGKGNFASYSEKVEKFTIKPVTLKKVKISGKKDSYTLTYATRDLIEGKDYEFVRYGEEKNGKVDVILKGKGDFGADPTAEIAKKVNLN